MVGLHGGYIADKPVVYMTRKGESWDSESAIRLTEVSNTELQIATPTSEKAEEIFDELRKRLCEPTYCSGTLVWYDKNVFNDETRAKVMGFKNANCLCRHIRRMKRKKEQERRRRLKNGAG